MLFDSNKFVKGSETYSDHSIEKIEEAPKKKRTRKKVDKTEDAAVATVVNNSPQTTNPNMPQNFLQTNTPYMMAYQDTNEQLDNAINELNMLGAGVVEELVKVKNSKTIKNKYRYITDMTQAATTIINAKIGAVREKNSMITNANNMDLKRMQQLKESVNEEDSNAKIASMYDAFINTPIGHGPNILGPSIADMTLMGGESSLPRMTIGGVDDQASWENNLSPAERRMLLESQGSIETVVVYDEATGNRWYEVIDKNSGQPIPDVEKPDNTFIYDLDINVRGGYAKDSNRNCSYRLVVINNGGGMSEY